MTESPKDELIVHTTEDYEYLPKGSGIYVKQVTETSYIGVWSSFEGSYVVEVPKKICKEKGVR